MGDGGWDGGEGWEREVENWRGEIRCQVTLEDFVVRLRNRQLAVAQSMINVVTQQSVEIERCATRQIRGQ